MIRTRLIALKAQDYSRYDRHCIFSQAQGPIVQSVRFSTKELRVGAQQVATGVY